MPEDMQSDWLKENDRAIDAAARQQRLENIEHGVVVVGIIALGAAAGFLARAAYLKIAPRHS